MTYCIGFDGVLAVRSRPSGALSWAPGALAGVRALSAAGHDVIVWTERMNPGASAEEREELESFLAEEVAAGTLRIATPELDGVKPVASVYIDTRAERFDPLAGAFSGAASWATITPAPRR